MKRDGFMVTDLNGYEIEVDDLEGAIEQAEYYRALVQEVPDGLGVYRQRYWQDLYCKLQKLKKIEDHA